MAKNPGAKDSSGKYLDPAAAIKAGLMQKKTGEFMSPGKVVAKVAAKVAAKSAAKSTAKGLKAAQGPSLAKGAKKADASSGAYERKIVKITAKANQTKGASRKEAYAKAAKTQDNRNAMSALESKKILARAKAEKIASVVDKSIKKAGK